MYMLHVHYNISGENYMLSIDKKRLVADIPKELHDEFKKISEKYNVTMTVIILDMINQLIMREKEYDKP